MGSARAFLNTVLDNLMDTSKSAGVMGRSISVGAWVWLRMKTQLEMAKMILDVATSFFGGRPRLLPA